MFATSEGGEAGDGSVQMAKGLEAKCLSRSVPTSSFTYVVFLLSQGFI